MSAPLKNTNAVKSPNGEASSHLHVRCAPNEKARWVKAAQGRKLKLAEWVIEILNSRAGQ